MIGGLPPLQWLVTFRAVMEAGSFARAAVQLNLTPSAISHQMRALEERLGRQLFLRRNRTVTPTEDAILYAASIGESFARLVTATHRVAAGPGLRRLPVHCSPSFATLWLVPRLASFQAEHPGIDISLFASHEPARLGEDGILVDIQYGRPVPDHCISIPLATETILPLASPDFAAHHKLSGPEDVARVPLIHSLRCVVSWEQWAARFAPATPLNPRGPRFDRAHLALACARDGLGLLLESTLQGQAMLRAGLLIRPYGDLGLPVVAHRVLYRRDDQAHPEITAFVGWLMRAMAETLAA
jgi:LysR family transcriptional regulator, glycine cleavage system transcriptional activator